LKKVCEGCAFHKEGEEFDATLHEITVPRAFFDDHFDRDLVTDHSKIPLDNGKLHADGTPFMVANVVKVTKNTFTVLLTMEDILELHSDADYYRTEWKYMGCFGTEGNEYFGLGMSAKATVKRIDKWLDER
jgi:hypothetical protein